MRVLAEILASEIGERWNLSSTLGQDVLDDFAFPGQESGKLSSLSQEYARADPKRKEALVNIIERGLVGDQVKAHRNHKCQVCEAQGVDYGFVKADGRCYAEAHHAR